MGWHVCREAFEPSAYANIWYKIGRLHDYWAILHRRYHEIVFAAKVACMKSVNIGPLCKPCIIECPGNAGNIAGRKMRCWNSMLQVLRMAAARKAAHSIRLENRRRLLPNRCIHPGSGNMHRVIQRILVKHHGHIASCGKDCDIRLVLSHVA